MSDDKKPEAPESAKPAEKTPCPDCGRVHGDGPFNAEMIEQFEKFKVASTEEARAECLLELARLMVEKSSETDPDMPEGWHELINEVNEAHVKWQSLALRVGRTIVRELKRSEIDKSAYEHLKGALLGARVVVIGGDGGPLTPPDSKKDEKLPN